MKEGDKALTGGMMKRLMPEQGLINYVDVKSVEQHSAKLEQLGGRVIFPDNGARLGLFCYMRRYRE